MLYDPLSEDLMASSKGTIANSGLVKASQTAVAAMSMLAITLNSPAARIDISSDLIDSSGFGRLDDGD